MNSINALNIAYQPNSDYSFSLNYIKSLISSALIPLMTPKLFYILDEKILIDGGIRTFVGLSSEFKRVRSIINKETTDEVTPTIYHL